MRHCRYGEVNAIVDSDCPGHAMSVVVQKQKTRQTFRTLPGGDGIIDTNESCDDMNAIVIQFPMRAERMHECTMRRLRHDTDEVCAIHLRGDGCSSFCLPGGVGRSRTQ